MNKLNLKSGNYVNESHFKIIDDNFSELEYNLSNMGNSVIKNCIDISNHCDGVEGLDVTSIIQKALDDYRRVIISKPGVYSVKGLKIGNDTTIECFEGVEIKLLPNTKKYILTNKDYTNGNRNIRIVGGKWNIDYSNGNGEVQNGSYKTGEYIGFGMHFFNVDGLMFENVKCFNAMKYLISVCNCKNIKGENLYFESISDGIHFQPPISNVYLKKIYGKTNDDLISFTLGDYEKYEVSAKGNFENVSIEDVDITGCTSIKIVGSGENHAYTFNNFKIENVYGVAIGNASIMITDANPDDQYATNDHLQNTCIENFQLKNITGYGTVGSIYYKAKNGKDLAIDNVKISSNTVPYFVTNNSARLGKLLINNIENIVDYSWLIKCIDVTDVIKQVSINNISLNTSTDNPFIKMNVNEDNQILVINNINWLNISANKVTTGIRIYGDKTKKAKIKINQFDFANINRIVHSNVPVELYYSNGNHNTDNGVYIDSTLTNTDSPSSMFISNSIGEYTVRTGANSATRQLCRINMDSGFVKMLRSWFSPEKYDKILNEYPDNNHGGYIVYDGEKWVQLVSLG